MFNSKKKLIAFCCVVLISVAAYFVIYSRGIERTSNEIFEGILMGDGQIVWDYSTADFRNVINTKYGGLESFDKQVSDAALAFRDLASWEIGHVTDFGDSATVQIDMKYNDRFKNHRYFLYLNKENDDWKLHRPRIMDN